MARPGPQTQAKRQREQAKRDKRRAKDEKKALRKAIKDGTAEPLEPDTGLEPALESGRAPGSEIPIESDSPG